MTDVIRDERTVLVENQSYRLAYIILLFGVLIDGSLRSMVDNGRLPDPWGLFTSNWDLLGLAIISSVVGTAYQATHGILGHISIRRIGTTMFAAALFASLLGLLLR